MYRAKPTIYRWVITPFREMSVLDPTLMKTSTPQLPSLRAAIQVLVVMRKFLRPFA
jgi:hypothetical protein